MSNPTIIFTNDNFYISFNGIGAQGAPGIGLPVGGTSGQVLAKIDSTNYNTHWVNPTAGTGTVQSVSIVSANGIAGTVANPTTTPAITLSTTVNGVLKGNGTTISAAAAGTDYVIPSGSITGTASNITATSNNTLTTLSALSLPYLQITGTPATGVSSVFGRTGAVIANTGDYSVSQITGAQGAITLTTTGTSGAATFSGNTLNIPQYSGTTYSAGTGLTLTGGVFSVNAAQTQITSVGTLTSGAIGSGFTTIAVAQGGTGVTTSTGTGNNVLSNSPTLVTPVLGTPSSGNLANCTFPILNQNTTGQSGTVATINSLISAGTNVTITGSGTSASPYNISASGGGSSSFNAITSGTNTTATMTVGTGASILTSGSGTIAATSVPASGIGSGTASINISGNAATVTTNANLTGDVTSSGNATTLATVNSNIGTFNNVTVNGKGLVTAASNVSYQAPITLTTTGTSGAATFISNTLNIPQYAGTTYTAGTGLTLTAGAFSVNTSQNIATLSNLTSNGFVKTSGGTGALSVDTTAYTPTSTTVNGHALSSNVTVTASDVGLGSVTNDAQTKAAIVPNTVPTAGQHLVGNAGGTAYAPVTMSGSGATITQSSSGVVTISAIANASLSNSTISGIALGGTLGALTATNTTLTFSGSYTGASAQTVGLNLSNANTWAALQTFGTNISIGGVTATGATGTGNNVFSASPTFTGTITAATGTFSGVVTSAVGTSTGNVATIDGAQTLTNKRITQRVLALSANSATPSINTDNYDVVHITAQTAAITSFTSGLTGTPVDGDRLRISITGTTAVALTWGASFESSTATLPTTTTSTNRLDVGFFWNTESSHWRCVAVA